MKHLKYLIFIFIVCPLNVFGIELYCDRYVNSGENFTCVISNNSNSLYELNGDLNYSNQITLNKVIYNNGYSSNGDNTMQKLGVKGRAQAVVELIRLKEITL